MPKKNLTLKACDFDQLSNATSNVYESILAVSNRSKQLQQSASLAFRAELEDLNIKEGEDHSLLDSDILGLVSKRYELAPKPLLIALEELLENKLSVTYGKDDDEMLAMN